MKYFALFSFLLISLSINAQSLTGVKVESGPGYDADRYNIVEMFEPTSEGYYILKSKFASYGYFTIDNLYIEHLDNDMNFISIKELELKEGKNSLTFEGSLQFGDNIHLITSFVNTAQKTKYIFSQTIDPQALTLSSPVKIAEVNQVAGDKTVTGLVRVRTSNDNSKAVIFACPPYSLDGDDKPSVTVLDNNMSVLWSKTLSIPFDMSNLPFEDAHVSNDGDVILYNTTYHGTRRSTMTSAVTKALKKSDKDQMVRVLTLTSSGEIQNSTQVKLANNFIFDMSVHFNENKDVVCAGYYCGNSEYEGRLGVYLINLKAGSLEQQFGEIHPFDSQTAGMMSAVQGSVTKEKEFRYIEPRAVFNKNDGSVFIISEREYVEGSSASSSSSSLYYWGNILVSKFKANGELEFTVTVPKTQFTQSPANWLSFESAMRNGVLYLFFNDREENANSTAGMAQKIGNPEKSLVCVFSVDSEGKVARTFITEKDNFINRNSLQMLDDGSVIISVVSGKRQMLNKVILP
jgi:hypothetical protein